MKKSSELFSISCQKFLLDTKFWNFFIILNLFQPQRKFQLCELENWRFEFEVRYSKVQSKSLTAADHLLPTVNEKMAHKRGGVKKTGG